MSNPLYEELEVIMSSFQYLPHLRKLRLSRVYLNTPETAIGLATHLNYLSELKEPDLSHNLLDVDSILGFFHTLEPAITEKA